MKSKVCCLLAAIFVIFLTKVQAVIEEETTPPPKKKNPLWDYEPNVNGFLSPEEWYKGYPNCAGKHQSPINIKPSETVFDDTLRRVVIHNEKSVEDDIYDSDMYSVIWSIHNNGKTVNLEIENGEIETLFENEKFSFQQMHFHWNTSEHSIDGKHYAAELHLVHRSLINEHKFAVLGFLFELSEEDNPALQPITKKLAKKRKHEFKKQYVNFDFEQMFPLEIYNFYRYYGSLTMPNCMEGVNWFVVADPVLKISQAQLEVFQRLRSDHNNELTFNSRPVQPINDRTIRRSWDDKYRRPKAKSQKPQKVHNPSETESNKRYSTESSSSKKLLNISLLASTIILTTIFF